MSKFKVGDCIDQRYEVLAILGEGGRGVVYKVKDSMLSQVVALKTLLPPFAKHGRSLERFINEVRVSLLLNHPNVIRVYGIHRTGDLYYMTMHYVEGISLSQWLKQNPHPDAARVLDILKKICAGLDYAHRMGTLHLDVKPSNVMTTSRGDVYVVDFGMAKSIHGLEDGNRSEVAGTPKYMAPEQKKGGRTGQRADIYSVGVMACELLTGGLSGLNTASRPNPELNTRADEVLAKATATDPSQRYGSVLEFFEELKEAFTPPSITNP